MFFRIIVMVLALFVFGVEVSFADQGEHRPVFVPDDVSLRDSVVGSIEMMDSAMDNLSKGTQIQAIKGLTPEQKAELFDLSKRVRALSFEINTQSTNLNKVFIEEDPDMKYVRAAGLAMIIFLILLSFISQKTKNEVKGAVTNPKTD